MTDLMALDRAIEALGWDAEYDANSLAKVEAIKRDKERYSRAQKAAVLMAEREAIKLNNLAAVAGSEGVTLPFNTLHRNPATIKKL